MLFSSYFVLMAQYNQSMNSRIYSAASQLSGPDLAKDQSAFFGSILHTLNHIMVADIIWLQRFARHQHFDSLKDVVALTPPQALNTVLFDDLKALWQQREKLDELIILFVAQLNDEVLGQALSYKNTQGVAAVKNFAQVLQHFFNHQTHHRGQVSTLLYQQGIDPGVTDLLESIPNIDS